MTCMKEARCVGLKNRRMTRSAARNAAAALAARGTGRFEATGSAEAVFSRGGATRTARNGDPCNNEALHEARPVGLKYRRVTRSATAAARAAAAALAAHSTGKAIGSAGGNGSEAVLLREEALATARDGDPCINDALPLDLIGHVLTKLDTLTDFGVARCVCKTWNEVVSSRICRPAIMRMPLWCLVRFETGWTNMDLMSGKEHGLELPSTSTGHVQYSGSRVPPGYHSIPKGQNGLISLCIDGEYFVTNPLLNKGQAAPPSPKHPYCEASTHELLVVPSDRCRAAWSSVGGRSNIIFLVVGEGNWGTGAFERFSVWEYDVDHDTLTLKVPMASLPYDEQLKLGRLWKKEFSFQIQVREPDKVELVAALPRPADRPPAYPALQVFLWDPHLARWCCRMRGEVDNPEPPAGRSFSGWWRDIEDPTYSYTCGGGRDRLLMTLQNVPANLKRPASPYLMKWKLSAVRPDNLQEWECELNVPPLSSPPVPAFCYFPSLDALP